MNIPLEHIHRHVLVFFMVGVVGCIAQTSDSLSETSSGTADFNYNDYRQILTSYVNDAGFVDYAGLQRVSEKLDLVADQFARLDQTTYDTWQRDRQFAFWINAYNALTLKAVIDHYPVKSIKDIGSPLRSVWDKLKFNVIGKKVTLNDIEHRILREQFQDPRLHLAINCASIGCPPLSNKPFVAEDLDQHFEKQARQFLNSELAFQINRKKEVVYLSKIFDWFGDDFIEQYSNGSEKKGLSKKEQATVRFVSQHVSDIDRTFLETETFRVKYLDYDWALNKQSPPP